MADSNSNITKLFSIRNRYGKGLALQKLELLNNIEFKKLKSKTALESLYATLLFMLAYPDNKAVFQQAATSLKEFEQYLETHESLSYKLYNTGVTGSKLCAAFSFEMVKWLRRTRPAEIRFVSFEAVNTQVQSILSVVMSKTESEIFQDRNAEWKSWLTQMRKPGEDLLDQLIDIFSSSTMRPELKDEFWNALGINVEISFTSHCALPASLTKIHYHQSLIKHTIPKQADGMPAAVKLSPEEARQLIDRCRMILVRKLRELDPISYTDIKYIRFYHLQRGMSIALMGMVPERRHPIDNYMGYVVFKNGLPVSYAGSWILFDSARISLNVFTDYRGGEAKYIFNQAQQTHQKVYHLKRFTVDPYQLGKDNSDGIKSGAFWIYYHAGYRPMKKIQKELAAGEQEKINKGKGYRSSEKILHTLSESRLELLLQKGAVDFDVTDLSRLYTAILLKNHDGNRNTAEKKSFKKLQAMLRLNEKDEKLQFIIRSWSVILMANEKSLHSNAGLKKSLQKLFVLKANGSEEEYNDMLRKTPALRGFLDKLLDGYEIK